MSKEYDYDQLLNRVREGLPDEVKSDIRLEIPDPEIIYEGKQTIFKNFSELASVINRDEHHLLGYLLRELGTAGNQDGRRVVFNGNVDSRQVQGKVNDYLKTFVICSECGRPDTKLEKDGRTLILSCEACGGHRPVKVKISRGEDRSEVSEGSTYDVVIQDIGQKGDGIAKINRYVLFVPGTTKGAKVKIMVERLRGNIGYCKIVSE